MKKIHNFKFLHMRSLSIIGLVVLAGLSSCDKVANPLKAGATNSSLPNTPPTYITSDSANMGKRKILLEDCTGHLCGNCPKAATEAETLLQSSYGPQIIMMQDNMGYFAMPPGLSGGPGLPPGAPVGAYAADYRCPADSAWDAYFNISNQGLPQGMIDRVHFSGAGNGTMATAWGGWSNLVDSLLNPAVAQQASIKITDSCWVPQRIIGTTVTVHFLTSQPGTYMLEACIIEDSIVDWQYDLASSNNNVSNFVHRNVLRDAYNNNPWGYTIPVSVSGTAGSYTQYLIYDFNKGENGKAVSWNMANCYVVAFVYNATTYDVIQADMVKIE